jgi:hypothetical protein
MATKDWAYLLFIDDEPSTLYKRIKFAKQFIGTVILTLVAVSIGIFYADKYINYTINIIIKKVIIVDIFQLIFYTLVCFIIMLLLARVVSFLFEIRSPVTGFFLAFFVIFPSLIKMFINHEILSLPIICCVLFVSSGYVYLSYIYFIEFPLSIIIRDDLGFLFFFFMIVSLILAITLFLAIFILLSSAAFLGVYRETQFYEQRKGLIIIKKTNDQEILAFISFKTKNKDIARFATNKIEDLRKR